MLSPQQPHYQQQQQQQRCNECDVYDDDIKRHSIACPTGCIPPISSSSTRQRHWSPAELCRYDTYRWSRYCVVIMMGTMISVLVLWLLLMNATRDVISVDCTTTSVFVTLNHDCGTSVCILLSLLSLLGATIDRSSSIDSSASCLCPNRRVNYSTPFSGPLNITYYHDYRQGDCCAWKGRPTVACSYNSTILLADALTYLNLTETIWVYDHGGALFDTSLDTSAPSAFDHIHAMVVWLGIFSAMILLFTLCWIYCGCVVKRRFDAIDRDNPVARARRHDLHSNGLVHGWLIGLHPSVAARSSDHAINTFINDPLYEPYLPALIASFAFDNAIHLRDIQSHDHEHQHQQSQQSEMLSLLTPSPSNIRVSSSSSSVLIPLLDPMNEDQ
jgi:hypothetical protein